MTRVIRTIIVSMNELMMSDDLYVLSTRNELKESEIIVWLYSGF